MALLDFFLSRKKSTANIAKERLQIIVAERRRSDAFKVRKSDDRCKQRRIEHKNQKDDNEWQAEKIAILGVTDAFSLCCFLRHTRFPLRR